jgi:hypothetical protein
VRLPRRGTRQRGRGHKSDNARRSWRTGTRGLVRVSDGVDNGQFLKIGTSGDEQRGDPR